MKLARRARQDLLVQPVPLDRQGQRAARDPQGPPEYRLRARRVQPGQRAQLAPPGPQAQQDQLVQQDLKLLAHKDLQVQPAILVQLAHKDIRGYLVQ